MRRAFVQLLSVTLSGTTFYVTRITKSPFVSPSVAKMHTLVQSVTVTMAGIVGKYYHDSDSWCHHDWQG